MCFGSKRLHDIETRTGAWSLKSSPDIRVTGIVALEDQTDTIVAAATALGVTINVS